MTRHYLLLDTCVLPTVGAFEGGFWAAVFALCRNKGIRPAVSAITLEETVNMRVEKSAKAIAAVNAAQANLSKLYPNLTGTFLPEPEAIGESHRTEVTNRFELIAVSGEAAIEALRREARRVPPGREGKGARDAAIWLGAMSLLKEGHTVDFVSTNVKDFGPGPIFPRLQEDVDASGGTFRYHTALDDFLGSIATAIPDPEVSPADISAAFALSLVYRAGYQLAASGAAPIDPYRLMHSQVAIADATASHSYEADGVGISYVAGRFTLADAESDEVMIEGSFGGWLTFDPSSNTFQASEVDAVTIEEAQTLVEAILEKVDRA